MFLQLTKRGKVSFRAMMSSVNYASRVFLLLLLIENSAANSDDDEYCLSDIFEPTCPADHVILMRTANYGRMRSGKCIRRDFGYIGCKTNVLHVADSMCSGRPVCSIEVPPRQFTLLNVCLEDLTSYMEATYDCIPVIQASAPTCGRETYSRVASTKGYLSSHVTYNTQCGSIQSPWLLEARPGQRFNLTLYDFSWTPRDLDVVVGDSGFPSCYEYAVLKESSSQSEMTVCDNHERVTPYYTSMSNVVEIQMIVGDTIEEERKHFLIEYEVIGCADIEAPPGTETSRNGDALVFVCDVSRVTWTMTCRDNEWDGTMKDCTQPVIGCHDLAPPTGARLSRNGNVLTFICNDVDITWSLKCRNDKWQGSMRACSRTEEEEDHTSLGMALISHELSIVIIILTAVFITTVILSAGFLCLKKSRSRPQLPHSSPSRPQHFSTLPPDSHTASFKMAQCGYGTKTIDPRRSPRPGQHMSRDSNDYAVIGSDNTLQSPMGHTHRCGPSMRGLLVQKQPLPKSTKSEPQTVLEDAPQVQCMECDTPAKYDIPPYFDTDHCAGVHAGHMTNRETPSDYDQGELMVVP